MDQTTLQRADDPRVVQVLDKVKAKVVKNVSAKMLASLVRGNVKVNESKIMTDEFKGYVKLASFVAHETVNHQREYVRGECHTNGIEGFWALLKRGITGQYHKVSLRHLPKYIDEFCFRYNHRKSEDIFEITLLKSLTLFV